MTPETLEFSPAHSTKLSAIAAVPDFQGATAGQAWRFALVSASRLVSIQGHVDERYATSVVHETDLTDTDSLIDLFLTDRWLSRGRITSFDAVHSAHVVLSPGYDARVLGPISFEEPSSSRLTLGFLVGSGTPYTMVVEFGGRQFLKNGYHRVYGAMRGGASVIPCVLVQGRIIEDTGANRPGFFDSALVQSDNPPMVSDFLSDEFSLSVRVQPVSKLIRIVAEETIIPARSAEWVEPARSVAGTASASLRAEGNFRVEAEEWSSFRLPDGTLLRMKPVLLRVSHAPPIASGRHAVSTEVNVLTVVDSPEALKGPPTSTNPSPAELEAARVESDMAGSMVLAGNCTYILDGRLKVVVQLTSVTASRTSRFDKLGNPIYLLQHAHSVDVQAI